MKMNTYFELTLVWLTRLKSITVNVYPPRKLKAHQCIKPMLHKKFQNLR